MSVASYVTLFRILTIFPIIYFVYFDSVLFKLISLLLFTLGALSDYLDGYIARKTDTTSEFGAKFDLITDKLFVCIILIFIISLRPDLLLIIPSLIIISREFVIIIIRQYFSKKEKNIKTTVSFLGKTKTAFQMVSIGALILFSSEVGLKYFIALSLIYISALLSLISLFQYFLSWRRESQKI